MLIQAACTKLQAITRLVRDHTGRARPPERDGTATAVDESAIAEQVRVAQTILVVSALPLDERLWNWLQERTRPDHVVASICPARTVPADVLPLVDARFRVTCAGAVDTTVLVLDDRVGFALPDGHALADPVGVAARWRWRRIGAYTRIAGTIGQREPEHQLFRLVERPHIWFSVARDMSIPPTGTAVTVLAYHMFWGQSSTALLLTAGLVQPADASVKAEAMVTAGGA